MGKKGYFLNALRRGDLFKFCFGLCGESGYSLFNKRLNCKPFQKRFERKPQTMFEFEILPPNPIGVINRRNGCDTIWSHAHFFKNLFKLGVGVGVYNVFFLKPAPPRLPEAVPHGC